MHRRSFIAGVAGVGITGVLAACAPLRSGLGADAEILPSGWLAPLPAANPGPQILPIDPAMPRFSKPSGSIYSLPSSVGNPIAWTVDDGWGSDVVEAYANFARDTGARITFFMCGKASSWSKSAAILKPMVDTGQVQIANHTHNHIRMVDASDDQIRAELMSNHDVITQLFGVDARPYFRPPYGVYDDRVARVAASVGYTVPVLWNATLSDSGEIDPEILLSFADRYMQAGNILLGHANYWPVTTVFRQLTGILEDRGLATVTLNDVFAA